ncbi:YbbR-like domain-containing protein [Geomicrobium sp. JCM 19039]|uniref:CdaR family protein n=1 Tax=Geomicrobium sp. JCM 19039 TaxID=1460636 RepID=UPI00045F2CCF|nr:CdaR family protein [Geomicrobium sp. JCM 19039]GAK10413.1 secreted protein associated with spyDAC [Geomicrobium sp. JCM 19039]
MDRLFNNHWFLKLVSLLIATMLFLFVNLDDVGNPGTTPVMSTEQISLSEAELQVYYDNEQYAIAEIDDDIDVRVSGTQSALTLFQVTNPSYEIYVDLEGYAEGVHTVDVETANFPSGLTVSVEPSTARVVLEERQSVTLPVEVELMNEDQIAEGHTVGEPEVTPGEVEINAGASVLDNISSLQAFIDVAGAEETITQTVDVIVYGPYGEQLDTNVEPETVEVEVPIIRPSAEVTLDYDVEGDLPEGLELIDMSIDTETATIYGPMDQIEDIESIFLGTLDLSGVAESEVREVEVPVPDGVEHVRPEVVTLEIEVTDAEDVMSIEMPLDFDNLPAGFDATIPAGEAETYMVNVHGDEEELQEFSEENLRLYIDFEDEQLETGETRKPIQIEGPTDFDYSVEIDNVPVEITESD